MPETRTKILEAFDRLSVAERVGLVSELCERIPAGEASFSLTAAQQSDLARRMSKYRSGKAVFIPWEDVKAEIEARLKSYRSSSKRKQRKT